MDNWSPWDIRAYASLIAEVGMSNLQKTASSSVSSRIRLEIFYLYNFFLLLKRTSSDRAVRSYSSEAFGLSGAVSPEAPPAEAPPAEESSEAFGLSSEGLGLSSRVFLTSV